MNVTPSRWTLVKTRPSVTSISIHLHYENTTFPGLLYSIPHDKGTRSYCPNLVSAFSYRKNQGGPQLQQIESTGNIIPN